MREDVTLVTSFPIGWDFAKTYKRESDSDLQVMLMNDGVPV